MSASTSPRRFCRSRRLTSAAQFKAVFAYKCAASSRLFTMWAMPNASPLARLGVVVPKAVIPTSVGRNYAKRVVREWFRHHQEELGGLDVVIRAKGVLVGGTPGELMSELQGLVPRAQRCRK